MWPFHRLACAALLLIAVSARAAAPHTVNSPTITNTAGGVKITYGDVYLGDGPVTLNLTTKLPEERLRAVALETADRILVKLEKEGKAQRDLTSTVRRWIVSEADSLRSELQQTAAMVEVILDKVTHIERQVTNLRAQVAELSSGLDSERERRAAQLARMEAVLNEVKGLLERRAFEDAARSLREKSFLLERWSGLTGAFLGGIEWDEDRPIPSGELRYATSLVTLQRLASQGRSGWLFLAASLSYTARRRDVLVLGSPGDDDVGDATEHLFGLGLLTGIRVAWPYWSVSGEAGVRGWLRDPVRARVELGLSGARRMGTSPFWLTLIARWSPYDAGIEVQNSRFNAFGQPQPESQSLRVTSAELGLGVAWFL